MAVGAPHPAPLDTGFRRYDEKGGRNDEKGGRNDEKGGRNDEKVGGGGRRAGGAAVCGVTGPFDRLRANGLARHVRRGGVGGGGAPPGAPGYRLPPV